MPAVDEDVKVRSKQSQSSSRTQNKNISTMRSERGRERSMSRGCDIAESATFKSQGKRYRSFSSDTCDANDERILHMDRNKLHQDVDGSIKSNKPGEAEISANPWIGFQNESLEWMKSNFLNSSSYGESANQISSCDIDNLSKSTDNDGVFVEAISARDDVR